MLEKKNIGNSKGRLKDFKQKKIYGSFDLQGARLRSSFKKSLNKRNKPYLFLYPKFKFLHGLFITGVRGNEHIVGLATRRLKRFKLRKLSLLNRLNRFVNKKANAFFFIKARNKYSHGKHYGINGVAFQQNYFIKKWKGILLNQELVKRYALFNGLKIPKLARILYGPFFSLVFRILNFDVSKFLLAHDDKYKVVFSLKFLTNFNITPQVLLHHLIAKLDLLYVPREILPKLLSKLIPVPYLNFRLSVKKLKRKRKKLLKGIMFKCSGRFTRAQMASYQVYKSGRVPLSTISANVRYTFGTISLKYGSLGLKVFLLN